MVEKTHPLDKRLDFRDIMVLAHCHGSGESRMGSPRYAQVCSLPQFRFAISDPIPMGSLIMSLEPTGLDEDCQLFKVRKPSWISTPPDPPTVA